MIGGMISPMIKTMITPMIGTGSSLNPNYPLTIAGLQLWLDASDLATIAHTAGAVSQWNDKSGNARHATQATAANQPLTGTDTINGRNVIKGDGADDILDLSNTLINFHAAPHTLIAVYKARSAIVAIQCIYRVQIGGSPSYYLGLKDTEAQNYTGSHASNVRTFDTGAHIQAIRFEGAGGNLDGIFDGAKTTTTSALAPSSTAGPYLFAGTSGANPFQGSLAEIILYSSVLTNAQLNNLATSYLRPKWGTPAWTAL